MAKYAFGPKSHRMVAAGLAGAVFFISAQAFAAPTALTAADKIAAFKAAGFTAKGKAWVRCDNPPDMASAQNGFIETEDLNGDGKPEVWVKESSTFCYGNTAEAFVLLGKDAGGQWKILLDEVGVPSMLKTKTLGWSDIEVGGPGMGPFPVYKYNGKAYVMKGKR